MIPVNRLVLYALVYSGGFSVLGTTCEILLSTLNPPFSRLSFPDSAGMRMLLAVAREVR